MNNSGVTPKGDRVLVMPDEIEETTEGGIIIPQADRDKHQLAQMAGVLVEVGPDAWKDRVTIVERLLDGQLKVVERRTMGYSEPFAQVGERVCFAQYNGRNFEGVDGKQYRLLNDEDITATVSDEVDFSDMKAREPLGSQGK